ncbi:MAG TPA: ABC transporter substrate-binding protein [Bryobacteraceae bacterium]|nr:ABC transporter substrate-binding protein [Bryobacteraceae bacterium]
MFTRIVLGCLLLAGCSGRKPAEVSIAVGGSPAQLIYLPSAMAQELGFYKESGLNVTLTDFQAGAKALEALMGGSADVVCGFYDHTIQMAATGKDLRAFVAIVRYPGMVLVSPDIATIEALKGKTVGVTAPGSSTHMLLNYLLVKHGMKPDDVSNTAIGSTATAVGAVTHHKVDAAVMTDPALAVVHHQMPGLHILADTRTAEGVRSVFGSENYLSTVLYSKSEWVEKNRDTAKRLALAITRTLSWMRSHTPEEIRERMPASLRTDDVQADLELLRTGQGLLSVDGKFTPEAVEAVHKVLSTSLEAVRNAKIDLAKTYTNELIP